MNKFFKKTALVLAIAMVFTAMPIGVFAEDSCANGHHYNPNYYWSTEEQSHRRACDRCGYADEEYRHEDTSPADGKCDVCKVIVDGNNEHTHIFTVLNQESEWHWYSCEDENCMQTDNWQEHSEPRTDSEGNIDFGIDPMGHNYYCAVCGEQYGAEMHTPGNDLVATTHPETNKEGHAAMCTVCGALAIATFEEHTPAVNPSGDKQHASDEDYHYEICSECRNTIDSTKTQHTAGTEWVPFDETSHVIICGTCWAWMPSVKENHTAPNEDDVCDKCYIPVDANGVHKHEVDNVWHVEWIEHVKRCNICGMATDMDFHTDANNDGKCDVCNATVEALINGEHVDYVHEHNFGVNAVSAGIGAHRYGCYGCDEYIYEPHIDENNDKTCDMCGVVFIVDIDAPSNSDYYIETNKIDESYVNNLSEDERTAFYEAVDAILEVAGDNTLNVFEIICKDKVTDDEVSEPDTKFVFTVTLPAGVIVVPEGQKIEWVMYRYHDGDVDVLPVTDNGDGTGSFESDKFSIYVLGYKFVNAHDHAATNVEKTEEGHTGKCSCGTVVYKGAHEDTNHDAVCEWCGYVIITPDVMAQLTSNRPNPNTAVTAEMLK